MRKFLILAVGALALVVVAVAVAQDPPTTVTSTTTVSPNKAGTKKKPQGVKLIYKATYTTPGDVEHPIITGGTVLVPKGALYNGGKYPKCSEATLNRGGPAKCPPTRSWARAAATPTPTTSTRSRGSRSSTAARNKICFYTVLQNPARVQAAVPATITKMTGKWAYKLTFKVPTSLQIVAGIPITLDSLNVTLGGKSWAKDWLATTSCPSSKKWPYQSTFDLSTGGSINYTAASPVSSRITPATSRTTRASGTIGFESPERAAFIDQGRSSAVPPTALSELTRPVVLRDGAAAVPSSWPACARSRLLAAMAQAAAVNGFLDVTVDDVIVAARASRRTFYEHFANREQCLLATYDAVRDDAMRIIAEAGPAIEPSLTALLRYFAVWPAHARVLCIDILAAGPAGLARHEATMGCLAAELVRYQDPLARQRAHPGKPALRRRGARRPRRDPPHHPAPADRWPARVASATRTGHLHAAGHRALLSPLVLSRPRRSAARTAHAVSATRGSNTCAVIATSCRSAGSSGARPSATSSPIVRNTALTISSSASSGSSRSSSSTVTLLGDQQLDVARPERLADLAQLLAAALGATKHRCATAGSCARRRSIRSSPAPSFSGHESARRNDAAYSANSSPDARR